MLAVPTQAQWAQVRRGPGLLRVDARGGWTQVEGALSRTDSNNRFDEQLQFQFAGWLVDPRVFQFTAAVSPTFAQTSASGVDQLSRSRATAFDVSTVLFPRRVVTVSARLTRTSGSSHAALGANSEQNGSTSSVQALYRHPYFPVRFSYVSQRGSSAWRNTLVRDPIVAVRQVRNVSLEMNNRRLRVRLGKNEVHDQNFSDDGGRASTTASVDHQLTWGRGSSLGSSIQYQDRSGVSESTSFMVGERLSIQHTPRARSNWQISSRSWGGATSSFKSRSVGGQLRVDVARGLEVGASVVRRTAAASGGTSEASLMIMPYAEWNGRLPLTQRATLAASGGYDRLSTQAFEPGTWVDVLEEEHRVGPTLRFVLRHINVDETSVEIWIDDLTLRLLRGVDYEAVTLGEQTEIQILPTGRVPERAVVFVTYRFAALVDTRASGLFFNARSTLDFGLATLGVGRTQRFTDSFGAGGGFDGVGYTETWTSLTLRTLQTPLGALALSGTHRVRHTEAYRSVDDEAQADLVLPLSGRVEAQIRNAVGRSVGALGEGRLYSSSGHLSVIASNSVILRGTVTQILTRRTGAEDQRFLSLRGHLQWVWGQVLAQVAVDHGRRWVNRGSASTRWETSLLRRF